MSDYLFDGEGPVDLEVARYERALAPFRYRRRAPWWRRAGVVLAAAAVLVVALGWLLGRQPPEWSVQTASCAGCVWQEGEWLDTSAHAEARLADRGRLTARPGTEVRLLDRDGRALLDLREGSLQVEVDAPARWLVVQLPGVQLVDLGCAYSVSVDGGGHGLVQVGSGWVALEGAGQVTQVPAGAAAATWPSGHTGLPVVAGAGADLIEAVDRFDRGDTAAWGTILEQAGRPEDALTVWHLLGRVQAEARPGVAEHLASLVPGVLPAKTGALVALDPEAMELVLAYLVGATL